MTENPAIRKHSEKLGMEMQTKKPWKIAKLDASFESMQLIRCTQCKQFPLQIPYMCQSGHILCVECVEAMGDADGQDVFGNNVTNQIEQIQINCPSRVKAEELSSIEEQAECGRKISQANFGPFWKIYMDTVFHCPNEHCDEKIHGRDMQDHLHVCSSGLSIECPVTQCKFKGRFPIQLESYTKHLQITHNVPLYECNHRLVKVFVPSRQVKLPNVWVCAMFETFGKVCTVTVEESFNSFYFYCQVVNEKDDYQENFNCRIEMRSNQAGKEHPTCFRWMGKMLPVTKKYFVDDLAWTKVNKNFVFNNFVLWNDFFFLHVWIDKLGSELTESVNRESLLPIGPPRPPVYFSNIRKFKTAQFKEESSEFMPFQPQEDSTVTPHSSSIRGKLTEPTSSVLLSRMPKQCAEVLPLPSRASEVNLAIKTESSEEEMTASPRRSRDSRVRRGINSRPSGVLSPARHGPAHVVSSSVLGEAVFDLSNPNVNRDLYETSTGDFVVGEGNTGETEDLLEVLETDRFGMLRGSIERHLQRRESSSPRPQQQIRGSQSQPWVTEEKVDDVLQRLKRSRI